MEPAYTAVYLGQMEADSTSMYGYLMEAYGTTM